MTGIGYGLIIGGLMVLLLALRVHIGGAMLIAGSIGYFWIAGSDPLLNYFKHAAYARYSVYDLSVVPLFLLMRQFATHGGLSRALFRAGATMIGHRRHGHGRCLRLCRLRAISVRPRPPPPPYQGRPAGTAPPSLFPVCVGGGPTPAAPAFYSPSVRWSSFMLS